MNDCENRILNEVRGVRGELSGRVGLLEKWRWLIIGGAIVIGLTMSDSRDWLMDFFK